MTKRKATTCGEREAGTASATVVTSTACGGMPSCTLFARARPFARRSWQDRLDTLSHKESSLATSSAGEASQGKRAESAQGSGKRSTEEAAKFLTMASAYL
eukprot:6212513-Pleurochrysis_carterae.AAC.4